MSTTTPAAKKDAAPIGDEQNTQTDLDADSLVIISPRVRKRPDEATFHLPAGDNETPACSFAGRKGTDWIPTTYAAVVADCEDTDPELCKWCDPDTDPHDESPSGGVAALLADPEVSDPADLDDDELNALLGGDDDH